MNPWIVTAGLGALAVAARKVWKWIDEPDPDWEERRAQAEQRFRNLTCVDHLLIDTCVWMNDEIGELATRLERILTEGRHTIYLCGAQLDELTNLKNRSKYDEQSDRKGRSARRAIDLIDRLQNRGMLKMHQGTLRADRNAYADPEILKVLDRLSREPCKITLVTDDKELRVRARSVLDGRSASSSVVETSDLLE